MAPNLRIVSIDSREHSADPYEVTKDIPDHAKVKYRVSECDVVINEADSQYRQNGSEYVFPGQGRTGHIVDVRKPWRRIAAPEGKLREFLVKYCSFTFTRRAEKRLGQSRVQSSAQ